MHWQDSTRLLKVPQGLQGLTQCLAEGELQVLSQAYHHNKYAGTLQRPPCMPKAVDPADMLGVAGAAVRGEQGTCGDIQEAAANWLSHQGAAVAELCCNLHGTAMGSTVACPEDGLRPRGLHTTRMRHGCCSLSGMRAIDAHSMPANLSILFAKGGEFR